ncbi:hypothetical protein MACK_002517 [Theileria orientalis]|uniref:Uncharacterized protein n=1 Tax=Theileria orientalis TaxID=68886 RepID=A0A976MD38_THEOR|nr:hypothetical protein MACK_002517 [Theileria orientalis]
MDNNVTYELEQTSQYGCVSVLREKDNPEKGFMKCTHTPSDGNTNLKSCVKYKNTNIMVSGTSTPIASVQNQIYDSIVVFFCENAKLNKNKVNQEDCLPLLVELNKKGAKGPEYYVHEYAPVNSKGSKWVKLIDWLKDVLPQLGLGTSYNQYGFYKLKGLLEAVNVPIKNGRKDLTETLSDIKGNQLKNLLQQNFGDSEDKRTLFNFVLFRIRFELSVSVIIFLEKNRNEKYNLFKIKKLINPKDESTIMNETTIVSFGHKEINHHKAKRHVEEENENKKNEKSDEEEDEEEEEDDEEEDDEEGDEDLQEMPFKYYTHHITINEKNKRNTEIENQIEICLFICNIKIETYDKTGTEIEWLYYEKSCSEVKVFFYEDDPRPLLVMCGNKAYRPKNLSCYYTKWVCVKIKEVKGVIDRNDTELMDTLCEIVYYLNPVKLEINSHKYHTGAKYIVQEFYRNKKSTSIEVDIFGEDMSCYKEYTHQAGTPIHALGEISHNGHKLFKSYEEYKKSVLSEKGHRFPDNVTVYYYMYDKQHRYPLMIELHHVYLFDENGYKEGTEDFYRLAKVSVDNMEWVKIKNDSGEGGQHQSDKIFLDEVRRLTKENQEYIKGLEDYEEPDYPDESPKYTELRNAVQKKLKEIRENLGISYEKKRKNLILETANNCREETNVSAIVGAVLPLGLLGIGAGVAYFKYSSNITHFYRKLF